MNWIQRQAEDYEIEVQIETHCVNPETDVVLEKISTFEDERDIEYFNEIAKQLDYEDINDFYHSIKTEFEGYNINFLFLNRSDSRCHMASESIDHVDQFMEYNMLYKPTEEVPDTFTFAHETLHAYSAMDLYDVAGTKEGAKAMKNAEKRFPEEVMLVNTGDIESNELSEITAFLIGWHDNPKSWYPTVIQPFDSEGFASFLKNHDQFDENGNLIIDEEEEIARYSYDGGEIVRYKINGQEDLIHWKLENSDEESEYWEEYTDENFYYLQDKASTDKITIPIQSGMAFSAQSKGDYEPWIEMKIV